MTIYTLLIVRQPVKAGVFVKYLDMARFKYNFSYYYVKILDII